MRGVVFTILLCLIPVVLWFPHATLGLNKANLFLAAGQLSGLVGVVLFAVNFILSTRLKFVDSLFSGLNKAYIVHHIIGGFALVLLLAHPVFIAMQFLPFSFSTAASLFTPSLDRPAELLGILALFLLTVLLIITFYTTLKYELWKFTHQFLGLAFLLGALHVYLIPSTVSESLALRAYMLTIITLGLVSYFYRTILGKYLIHKTLFYVDQVTALNSTTTEIRLRPGLNSLKFTPGQFVFISALGQTHPFSITAKQGSKDLTFAVKALGDYTAAINQLTQNSQVLVEGPFGKFSYKYYANLNQIWIAGGIGITPLLSMSRSIESSDHLNVHLFWAVKNSAEAVYLNELEKNPLIKFHLHESEKSGYLTAEVIKNTVPDFKNYDVFVCGPPVLMTALRRQCKKLGLPDHKIHDEQFALQ